MLPKQGFSLRVQAAANTEHIWHKMPNVMDSSTLKLPSRPRNTVWSAKATQLIGWEERFPGNKVEHLKKENRCKKRQAGSIKFPTIYYVKRSRSCFRKALRKASEVAEKNAWIQGTFCVR